MKHKKMIFVMVMLIVVVACSSYYFFCKKDYKSINFGNTSNMTTEQITDYILNLSSYEAEISVEVQSNKNQNKYRIKQQYQSPNIFKQEVLEPTNIQGLKTIFDGSNLRIENSKIGLTEIYENYQYISENSLCLYHFIEIYQKNSTSKMKEEKDQIILETKVENSTNKYAVYETLTIDKKTAKPVKLEIQDVNQKMLVYILYNEIKINSVNKEEILAFKVKTELENI